nr:MAG TPA: hypothetical protein [Caudoviricetes sp.]
MLPTVPIVSFPRKVSLLTLPSYLLSKLLDR